jgi:hypothetical protein
MLVDYEQVKEDFKRKDAQIDELKKENKLLNARPELRKVYVYEHKRLPSDTYYTKVLGDEVMFFHCWGCDYEEFETGAGNYSTAILEKQDGTIINERADFIKFI